SDESVRQAFAHIKAVYGTKIASVIHLAAYYSFDQKHSPLYEKITVQGTERLLKALEEFDVDQFIFSSTMLVHAPCKPGHPIKESDPLVAKWDYPLSKIHTEKIIREKRGRASSVILRISGVYDNDCDSIPISHQIQRIFEKQMESRVFSGNVHHGASFLHMDDLVDAMVLCVDKRKQLPNELTLLIGEPKTFSYDYLQRKISRLLFGREFRTWRVPKLIAKVGSWMLGRVPFTPAPFIKPWMIDLADDHYELDISLAQKTLGWQPRHSLDTTLPVMIERFKGDPIRWYKNNHLDMPKDLKERIEKKEPMMEKPSIWKVWTFYVIIWLGFWLLTAHVAMGYPNPMALSDFISGLLLILLGFLSTAPQRLWSPWACALVGVWLNFAPLIFWANHPGAYINDTLVGSLVIALSILIPGIRGRVPDQGPSVPPGWSYNPSSWPQRLPVVVLGTVGWFISRYLASEQLGYIDYAWDPVFGHGTMNVITSAVSKAFPVSDAGLGAMAYTMEVLLALKGDERRWRTMPWMVLLFGLIVVPLGLVSITLIVLQPLVVGSWCFLCLVTAVCMMVMISFAVDEVVAVLQFLRKKRQEGKALASVFWKGDSCQNAEEDLRTPHLEASMGAIVKASTWGVGVPWNLVVSALLGGAMMLSPWFFDLPQGASDSAHVVGALAIVISVIAMAEVIRKVRYVNILLGLWILLSPIWFQEPWAWESFVGLFLILLAFRKGPIYERYGTWEWF
ncbi:MAG TPA: vitamin K epoxide reductase family protein, partial [Chlamydiales bacterium]|nr:vitamin K epoxide reductase family protein [Chlamydiales bacterium]